MLLYVDGDSFKPINDRHGHAAGDVVLIETAARIRSCLRARDVAARRSNRARLGRPVSASWLALWLSVSFSRRRCWRQSASSAISALKSVRSASTSRIEAGGTRASSVSSRRKLCAASAIAPSGATISARSRRESSQAASPVKIRQTSVPRMPSRI
ncbi:MAG TPA: diguanylate cyclase [Sphingomonas sp.]|nr:diguanylate cyclase [Sphingomonas sp.]